MLKNIIIFDNAELIRNVLDGKGYISVDTEEVLSEKLAKEVYYDICNDEYDLTNCDYPDMEDTLADHDIYSVNKLTEIYSDTLQYSVKYFDDPELKNKAVLVVILDD